MTPDDLPLLELFTRLRQAGLPLGMNEYQLVLQALESGFGLPDKAALARLCRTLWAKSAEDQLLFNYHFEQVMAEDREKLAPADPWLYEEAQPMPVQNALLEQLSAGWKQVPRRDRWGLIGMALFAVGTALWSTKPQCPYFTSSPPEVVEQDEAYSYRIVACKSSPADDLEITALVKHPWLNFESKGDGTAQLSAAKDDVGPVNYSQTSVWDFQGNQLSDFNHQLDISTTEFSPDGQWILTRTEEGTASLWDLQGNKKSDFVNSWYIQFSPDSRHLLTGLTANVAHLWDLQGNEITDFDGLNTIEQVSFTPDGQHILIRSGEGSVYLWDAQGNKITDLNNLGMIAAELLPQKKQILTLSTTGVVQFWDWQGQPVTGLDTIKNIQDIKLSPNQQHFLTYSTDEIVSVWNLQGVPKARRLEIDNPYWWWNTTFSPQGRYLSSLEGESSHVWDLEGNLLTDFDEQYIEEIAFSHNEQVIATRSFEGVVQLWNLQAQPVDDFKELNNIQKIIFTANDFLLTEGNDSAIVLWDLQGKQISRFDTPLNIETPQTRWDLNISPDAQFLTTVEKTRKVQLQVVDKNNPSKRDMQTFELVRDDDIDKFYEKLLQLLLRFSILSGALIALVLPVGYVLSRWWMSRGAKPAEFPPLPERENGSSTAMAELNKGLNDEVQVAQAIHQKADRNSERSLNSFSKNSEYFPMTSRQMQQSWRYLRRLVREGPPVELDVAATIRQVSCDGMLLQPILRARRVNRNELLLLVDQDGSMVPFHSLSERLAKTAISGGRLASTGIYYFHNCPSEYLYHDPYHQEAEAISDVLAEVHSEYTGVLIFSDAGAARGAFNQQRLDLTIDFLEQLRGQLRYVAWLNPMSRDRWDGTASEISKHVPMFELSHQGLNQAIDVLRGKSIPVSNAMSETTSAKRL